MSTEDYNMLCRSKAPFKDEAAFFKTAPLPSFFAPRSDFSFSSLSFYSLKLLLKAYLNVLLDLSLSSCINSLPCMSSNMSKKRKLMNS